jgi:outer membrane receptor for ferrienterochelin and colicins
MKGLNTFVLVAVLLAVPVMAGAQSVVRGSIRERTEGDQLQPVPGAGVNWLGTRIGTSADTAGNFTIPLPANKTPLVVRCVGYLPDTVDVDPTRPVLVILKAEARQVADVEIVGERSSTSVDYLDPRGVQVMNQKELIKAACCNLSESFTTNPSVDVSFTDAITGTKQIEMLGLAGVYSQITAENLPAIRGLASNVGLSYIPGTWIQSIQVSKGVGSVANGYESITGQINVELRKPDDEEEKRFYLNLFGNQESRLEGNLHYRQALGNELSSLTFLHFGALRRRSDTNGDRFVDMPLSNTTNVLQRFNFANEDRWIAQLSANFVDDRREGGTTGNDHPYDFAMHSQQTRVWGKIGHVFSTDQSGSFGLQWSLSRYHQTAMIGEREYTGDERTGYLNFLLDSQLGTKAHRLRGGLSFLFDQFDESFTGTGFARIERVPGLFAEYTFSPDEDFTVVAGIRLDRHNEFGSFATPRLHVRYAPDDDWVFRVVGGRGQRTANALAENLAYLASSRRVDMPPLIHGYPFSPEVGWNIGFNLTHYFLWDYREVTMTVDYYRTWFENQVVVDLDRNPQVLSFSNLDGVSYSNSVQWQIDAQPIERLETRVAYRYLDVRQTLAGTLREHPFVARHRAFVNLAYSTDRENPDQRQMLYDFTVQWYGPKRLPDTQQNPPEYRVSDHSPSFALVNAQVTMSFTINLDLYIGVENLLNFRQSNPILDADHPDERYFDSALVWGPITGRTAYLGMRLHL